MKTCVIYSRVSSELQDVENSISAQVKACQEYAQKKGFTVKEIFTDKAESGKSSKRPEFQRMISEAKKREFDVILIHKFDRFARNREDAVTYKALLRKHKIELYSVTEQLSDDLYGRLIEGILEVTAEFYSFNLALETKKGQREVFEKGFYPGGLAPYGYKFEKINNNGTIHSKLKIIPEEASVIQELFQLASEGILSGDLILFLNNSQLKPRGISTAWSVNTLRYLLRNKIYIGVSKFDKTEKEDIWPAIISKELFFKVQNVRKSNQGVKANSLVYPLSGLIYCSFCNNKLFGTSCEKGKMKYYRCSGYIQKRECPCKCTQINAAKIEKKVKEIIIDTFQHCDFSIKSPEPIAYKENKELLKKKLTFEKEKQNIITAITKGIDPDLFKEKLENIKRETQKIEKILSEEKNKDNQKKINIKTINKMKELIPLLTPKELKEFYKSFLRIEFNLKKKQGIIELKTPFYIEPIEFVL